MGTHSFLWHQASFYGIQKRTAGEERVRRQEKIWKEKLERRERKRKKERNEKEKKEVSRTRQSAATVVTEV